MANGLNADLAEGKIVPPRPRLAAVPEDPRERAPDLRDAVAEALDAMTWLTPSDQALATLARRNAEEIEQAADPAEELAELQREFAGDPSMFKRLQKLEAMCEVTKTVGWLGPQLQGYLRDLGGTPASRAALKVEKPVKGRLAHLRAAASGQRDP